MSPARSITAAVSGGHAIARGTAWGLPSRGGSNRAQERNRSRASRHRVRASDAHEGSALVRCPRVRGTLHPHREGAGLRSRSPDGQHAGGGGSPAADGGAPRILRAQPSGEWLTVRLALARGGGFRWARDPCRPNAGGLGMRFLLGSFTIGYPLLISAALAFGRPRLVAALMGIVLLVPGALAWRARRRSEALYRLAEVVLLALFLAVAVIVNEAH